MPAQTSPASWDTCRGTHTCTHAHACTRTTARGPALGRVNTFSRGSSRPVSQEKKCGQTRPRQPVGPALAATPESRWPLESGGETQPPPWPGTPVAAAEEHRGQTGRPRGSRGAAGAAAQAGACGRPTPSGTDPRAACPRISLRENCAACPWAHGPAAASPCSLTLSLGGSALASGRCGSWLREVQDRTPSPGPPGMMPVQQSCLCWLREVWTDSDPVASGKAGERQAQSPPLPGGPSPLARTRQAWPDPMTVGKPRGAWGLQWETR